ncbi:CLIP domain-containing serine protease [Basidiobolus ranarum]|uniref:CLIP domain-containing serine protease n=1 Tax=Basidiobolus ranarum TaxID=34480 RepID=A0ABR2W8H8_9FUNG
MIRLEWLFFVLSLFFMLGLGNSLILKNKVDNIRGGVPVESIEYPYLAHIFIRDYPSCGASILDSDWIITAAHCLFTSSKAQPVDFEEVKVVVGNTPSGLINPINIRGYMINPNFRLDTYSNDIALIQLKTSLTFNSTVQSVVIGEDILEPYQSLVALGWGQTELEETSERLQAVGLHTSPLAQCHSQIPAFHDHNGQFICTDFVLGKDTCPGDSGGPLIRLDEENIHNRMDKLMGITSFGVNLIRNQQGGKCGENPSLGYYTRVSTHLDFIESVTGMSKDELVGLVPKESTMKLSKLQTSWGHGQSQKGSTPLLTILTIWISLVLSYR